MPWKETNVLDQRKLFISLMMTRKPVQVQDDEKDED